MDLFDLTDDGRHKPLADRMRPRTLEEFFGQEHLLGVGKMLRKVIENDRVPSMILQGPPSSGKTSLAGIISEMTKSKFLRLNGVSLGIADVREAVAVATEERRLYGRKTILFIDEIHAMKSNVQMALLPVVEDGTLTLIGATTESVMHDIIPPLVSRCRVYNLKPLTVSEMKSIIKTALVSSERGLGDFHATITEEALDYLVDVSNGDIRSALLALESAVDSLWDQAELVIDLKTIQEAYELRLNNTSTSDFYNLTSAFIKSMRGSQTDAAMYWLARMLYSGIDPIYIARRVVVHAAEDVGMANPQALQMAVAAKDAIELLGMPEGRIPLAEAVVFICESPKSNSVYKAINQALEFVRKSPAYDVPSDIKHGSTTYRNPIDEPNHRLTYLPPEVQMEKFYTPQPSGIEARIYHRHLGIKPSREERE